MTLMRQDRWAPRLARTTWCSISPLRICTARLRRAFEAIPARPVITPAEARELEQLYAQIPGAVEQAAEALRTGGYPPQGAPMQRYIGAETPVSQIFGRIKAITGDDP
jgi:hypothetical protein